MYQDTIFVDTVAAIRQLYFLKIPFKTEVKGITFALLNSVHNSLAEEAASAATPTAQPYERTTVPPSANMLDALGDFIPLRSGTCCSEACCP
jgi:hypothetical protein